MVLIDDGLNGLGRRIAEDTGDLCRRERELREPLRIRRPGNNVDPLTAQLVHDCLNTRALEPDARSHRIDRIVTRENGDLGAAAHLACRRSNLDDALLDLGYLELEKRLDEERVRATENQSRSLRRLLHPLEDGADWLALMEMLAVVLFAIRNDCLRLAELVEHHHKLAALDLLDLAGQQIADARRELIADARALTFANALNDPLLRRLYGGATKDREVDRFLEHVTDLEPFVITSRVVDGDLTARVLDAVDDVLEKHDADLALAVIDVDFGLNVRSILFRERGHDAILQKPVELRTVELLHVRQLAERGEYFC